MLEVGDWATWVGSIGALVIAVVAGAATWQLRRRERRLALVELHAVLTSGEIAAGRNTIGTLLYSESPEDMPSRLESIEAYFRLIWAVQRARNTFLLYKFDWSPPTHQIASPGRRSRYPERILTWNLIEISENLVRFHKEYGTLWNVEDRDAWEEMQSYLRTE